MTFVDAGAEFSDCGRYRYRWWRTIAPGLFDAPEEPQTALWVLHNPSSADEEEADPTTRRVIEFSRAWGCRRVVVLNRLAYIATDPSDLVRAVELGMDIEGPKNRATIDAEIATQPRYIVAAWGTGISLGWRKGRYGGNTNHRGYSIPPASTSTELGRLWATGRLCALRLNQDGSPAHPLYVPYSAAPSAPRRYLSAFVPGGGFSQEVPPNG